MLTTRKPYILSLTLLLALGVLVTLVMMYLSRRQSPSCSQEFDLIVQGAEVFDGSGNVPFVADIGIKGKRIACVGDLAGATAKETLDAHGLSVAPGFIDVHTHIERNVPTKSPFLAPNFVRQGVTTVITGNCGRSFPSIAKFFNSLEVNGSQVNVATLVGHNTIRQAVMNQSSSAPSPEQLKRMRKMVDQAMADGALGMSTGLGYVPGTFARTDEIVELTKPVAESNGLYVSHIRDESTKGVEAIQEAITIGRKTGASVHISHFKVQGPTEWGTAQARLDLLKSSRASGQKVSLDQYPYSASSTGLVVLLPAWISEGGLATAKRRLADSAIRSRLRAEMIKKVRERGWTDYSFARIAYYQADKSLVGLNIAEVTEKRTKAGPISQHVKFTANRVTENENSVLTRQADTVIDLFTHGGAQMVFFDMADDDITLIMKDPEVMFGSDSSVRDDESSSRPHPRGYGTFPRVLGLYSREKSLFPLEEAIRRMTSLPAATFGIKDRGYIRPDYWADLVIFDRNQVLDTATYEEPLSPPNGINYVIVNGSLVLNRQKLTSTYPGGVIRHQSASAHLSSL